VAGTPLEPKLLAVCESAEAAWPAIAIDRVAFAEHLGASPVGRALVAAAPAFDAEHVAEVALAFACGRGVRGALDAFEATYMAALDRGLASMRLSEAMLSDTKQAVREKLLVRQADGALRLEEYAGQGRLHSLVHVVATRAAIGALRRTRREVPERDVGDDLFGAEGSESDPETRLLRERYRADLRASLEEAAGHLTKRERNLLRLHLLGGVTLEALASMYGAHRATVVRWLARARAAMLAETKKALGARVKARPEELESLMGLVASRFEVSMERILETTSDGG
jgi:RNA polymerase sigma-70 factor, ECF subfamily